MESEHIFLNRIRMGFHLNRPKVCLLKYIKYGLHYYMRHTQGKCVVKGLNMLKPITYKNGQKRPNIHTCQYSFYNLHTYKTPSLDSLLKICAYNYEHKVNKQSNLQAQNITPTHQYFITGVNA